MSWTLHKLLKTSPYTSLEPTGISGTCPSHLKHTYDDVLTSISKRFCLPKHILSWNDSNPNPQKQFESNSYSTVCYNPDDLAKHKKSLGEDTSEPDYSDYELVMINITIYRSHLKPNSEHMFNRYRIEEVQINTIFKIIRSTPRFLICKMPDFYRLNHGRGPTLPYIYVLLEPKTSTIYPIPQHYSSGKDEFVNFERFVCM